MLHECKGQFSKIVKASHTKFLCDQSRLNLTFYAYVGNMIALGQTCQVSNRIIVFIAMQRNLKMSILGVAPSIYWDTDGISHSTGIHAVAI